MMNEFIKTLLSLSVSGTLLLLIIWGLKPLYKNKFSKSWQYYIWIIVALRFIFPFTLDTTIIGSMFERIDTTAITNENSGSTNTLLTSNTHYKAADITLINENTVASNVQHNSLDIYGYLFFIWLTCALVLFIRKITIYQGFIQYVKAGNEEVSDIKILNLLSDCEDKLNIKTRSEIYRNVLIASPVIIGFFRPRIILPVRELTDKELYYIITHELFHYKKRDMFYKWLIQVVSCVHWFNPFVYLLEKEVNKACELSCDEAVISILDDKAKREYGDTLLAFVKTSNQYKSSLASVTLTEGAKQLKERLGAIMNLKKKSKSIKAVTVIFTCVLCVCFTAAGAYAAPIKSKEKKAEEQENNERKMTEQEISVIGDETYRHDYTQKGYYWDSYIIEIGWNLYGDMKNEYSQQTEFVLEDGSNMTVYFADAAKDCLADSRALNAASGFVSYLKRINTYPEIETPLIAKISYIGDKDIPALRQEYYQNGDICGFFALFSLLDETEQKEWYQKIYDTDKIAFFSSVIEYMDNDLITLYADKAEQDEKIEFFYVILDYLQPDIIRQYAEKYYEADNISGFTVVTPYMTENEQQEWLKMAQKDKKAAFSSVLSDNSFK